MLYDIQGGKTLGMIIPSSHIIEWNSNFLFYRNRIFTYIGMLSHIRNQINRFGKSKLKNIMICFFQFLFISFFYLWFLFLQLRPYTRNILKLTTLNTFHQLQNLLCNNIILTTEPTGHVCKRRSCVVIISVHPAQHACKSGQLMSKILTDTEGVLQTLML